MKSISPIKFKSLFNSEVISKNRLDKLSRIFWISIDSLIFNSFISLFKSNTEIGSINRVEPELEISWTKPLNSDLYSAFTGITNLSFLTVTIGSCINFWCNKELSFPANFLLFIFNIFSNWF